MMIFRKTCFFVNGKFSVKYINFLIKSKICKYIVYKKKLNKDVLKSSFVNYLNYEKIENINLNFNLFIVFDFGLKLSKKIYLKPKYGTYVIHPSFLPFFRGKTPLTDCLIYGKNKGGISIFKINEKIDKGEVYLKNKFFFLNKLNFYDFRNLVLKKILYFTFFFFCSFLRTKNILKKQICYLKKKKKEETNTLNWKRSSNSILKKIKAYFPKANTTLGNKIVIILEAKNISNSKINITAGSLFFVKFRTYVICGTGILELEIIKVGNKTMCSKDFYNGYINTKLLV